MHELVRMQMHAQYEAYGVAVYGLVRSQTGPVRTSASWTTPRTRARDGRAEPQGQACHLLFRFERSKFRYFRCWIIKVI